MVWTTWSPIIAKLTNSKLALSSTVSSAQSYTSQTAIGQTNSKTATATVRSLLSTIVGLSSTSARLTTWNTATRTTSGQTISKTATLQQILLTTVTPTIAKLTTSKSVTATTQSNLPTTLSPTVAKLTTSRTAIPTNPTVVPPPTMVSDSWPCDSILGMWAPSNCAICYLDSFRFKPIIMVSEDLGPCKTERLAVCRHTARRFVPNRYPRDRPDPRRGTKWPAKTMKR